MKGEEREREKEWVKWNSVCETATMSVRWVRSFSSSLCVGIGARYLRVHYYRACCWSASLCWRWPVELANGIQALDCRNEEKLFVHSVAPHRRPVPIVCLRICNDNRWPNSFPAQRSSANLFPSPIKQCEVMETFACGRKLKKKRNFSINFKCNRFSCQLRKLEKPIDEIILWATANYQINVNKWLEKSWNNR